MYGVCCPPPLACGSRLEWSGMHRAKQIRLQSNLGKLVYQIDSLINFECLTNLPKGTRSMNNVRSTKSGLRFWKGGHFIFSLTIGCCPGILLFVDFIHEYRLCLRPHARMAAREVVPFPYGSTSRPRHQKHRRRWRREVYLFDVGLDSPSAHRCGLLVGACHVTRFDPSRLLLWP